MKKGIIFDMDGTLWDSAENVVKAWNTIIEQPQYALKPLVATDMYRVMGMTMDALGQALWSDVSEDTRTEILQKCYGVENSYLKEHGGRLYPKLTETLEKLKEKYHLYIVSNCQAGYIEAFLDHYKLWYLFDDIECYGNNNRNKGENISDIVKRNNLDKAVYVGDIQGDYDATMEAGIDFVHAAYGFGTISQPVERIDSISELLDVADKIFND